MSHTCSQKDIRKQKNKTKSYSKRLRYEKSQSSSSGIQNYKWQLVNRICRLEKTKHTAYIAQKCFQDSRNGEIWVQGDEYVQWTHKECAAYDRGGGFTFDLCDDD